MGIFDRNIQHPPVQTLAPEGSEYPRFQMLIEKNYAKQQVYIFLGLCPSPSMKGRFFLWMPCPNTCSFRCYDRSCGQTIQQRGEFWKKYISSLSFHFVVSVNSISYLLQNCHLVLKKKLNKNPNISSVFSPLPAAPLSFLTKTPVEAAACRRSCRRRCFRFFFSSFFCAFKRLSAEEVSRARFFRPVMSPNWTHKPPFCCLKRNSHPF